MASIKQKKKYTRSIKKEAPVKQAPAPVVETPVIIKENALDKAASEYSYQSNKSIEGIINTIGQVLENLQSISDKVDDGALHMDWAIDQIFLYKETNNKRLDEIENQIDEADDRYQALLRGVEEVAEPNAGTAAVDKPSIHILKSLESVASSLTLANDSIRSLIDSSNIQAYQAEQTAAAPAATTTPTANRGGVVGGKREQGGSTFSLLKDLFTNPAVVAALAGIVYTVLPKDIQDKVKSFLGGFASGLEEAVGKSEEGGLKGLGTALKIAAGAIAVAFGAKLIGGIASAITTTIKIIKSMKGISGKKMLALGAGAAIGAAIISGKDEEDETESAPAPEPEEKPAVASTSSSASTTPPTTTPEVRPAAISTPPSAPGGIGMKPSGTIGIKPGGAQGEIIGAMQEQGITNKFTQVALMANIEKESGFKPISENLNYSTTDRLRKVFPSRTKNLSDDELKQYTNNPEGLAELVYGGKMGNDRPGDGFKYRGRGYIQLTGKDNYRHFGKLIGADLLSNPDLANDPVIAAKIASAFIKSGLGNKVNSFTNQSEANKAVTQTIGGAGLNLNVGYGADLLGRVSQYAGRYESIPSTTMVASATSGQTISSATSELRTVASAPPIQVASINNSSTKGAMGGDTSSAPPPIPSPIANRGSLLAETRHSTAYV